MSSRISDLEKALTKGKDSKDLDPLTPFSQSSERVATPSLLANALYSGPLHHRSRGDIVIQKGSSSQYFNEILLSRVLKEVPNSPIRPVNPHPS